MSSRLIGSVFRISIGPAGAGILSSATFTPPEDVVRSRRSCISSEVLFWSGSDIRRFSEALRYLPDSVWTVLT